MFLDRRLSTGSPRHRYGSPTALLRCCSHGDRSPWEQYRGSAVAQPWPPANSQPAAAPLDRGRGVGPQTTGLSRHRPNACAKDRPALHKPQNINYLQDEGFRGRVFSAVRTTKPPVDNSFDRFALPAACSNLSMKKSHEHAGNKNRWKGVEYVRESK